MDELTTTLDRARTAYAERQWAQARERYMAARALAPLSAEDMAAFSDAAWWEGAIDESLSACEEAYRLYLHGDEPRPRPAAMLALEIGFSWYLRGEESMGSGWISRAQRLLEDETDCVEHGYLQAMAIDEALGAGESAWEVNRPGKCRDSAAWNYIHVLSRGLVPWQTSIRRRSGTRPSCGNGQ